MVLLVVTFVAVMPMVVGLGHDDNDDHDDDHDGASHDR